MTYAEFRLGLSFADVRAILYTEQQAVKAKGQYMFVTRRTVIGRMHEYKLAAYKTYLEGLCCGAYDSETCASCPGSRRQ